MASIPSVTDFTENSISSLGMPARVFSGLLLVRLRGEAMQRAAEQIESGMASLMGADEAQAVATDCFFALLDADALEAVHSLDDDSSGCE